MSEALTVSAVVKLHKGWGRERWRGEVEEGVLAEAGVGRKEEAMHKYYLTI